MAEPKITKKYERILCNQCGTDRRWRQGCARGPACWKQATQMGDEPKWFDQSPKERKKRSKKK